MKIYLLLLILCIGVSLTGCQEKSEKSSSQFEYKVEYFIDSSFEEALNKLGLEGWQIVGSRRATSTGVMGYELILMRDIGESELVKKSDKGPSAEDRVKAEEMLKTLEEDIIKLNEEANKNE